MVNESILFQELEKLEISELKKTAGLWNLTKFTPKDKKQAIDILMNSFLDEFLLRGILEKLTPVQVTIYTSILKNKNVMTLGEIVRKIQLPPINAEMELNVLRKYFLLFQRKNRERLTNNLDKYHAFEEIAKIVKLEQNLKGEKYKISLEKNLSKKETSSFSPEWLKLISVKKNAHLEEICRQALEEDSITAVIESLDDIERETIHFIFVHGGIIEVDVVRNFITTHRGRFETVFPRLIELHLIEDLYFIEDRFIRIAVIPKEIFTYMQTKPVLQPVKKGTRQKQEKVAKNDLDFFLNIKKMISFISRKGLNLAKSGKVKQADNKRTEQDLLKPDIEIFPEKGQVYQIELILPIMKLLNLIDIKGENLALDSEVDQFLRRDIFEVMNMIIHEVHEARSRRINFPEVFTPTEVPFYDKPILDKCVNMIISYGKINISVIFANVVKDHLIHSPGFKIKNFETDLIDLRKEIISAVFYLHLFGLIEAEYPDRNLSLSELGRYYFQSKSLHKHTEKGGIMINPDFTIIAFPEKVSMHGIHLLKAFTELKDFDRVYTFVLKRDSFQQGILLGYDYVQFVQFLRDSNKVELAQNLLFLFEEWSQNLPVVVIKEDCVILKTTDSHAMELLTGQVKSKKIILEEISPTAILIEKSKIPDIITVAEKLNLIIKLIR